MTLTASNPPLLSNPFLLAKDGGDYETAEAATNAYIPWLDQRLRDTSSEEYQWFEAASERLAQGEKLELGCCGDKHCHTVYINHLLNTGDWRRWDVHSVSEWIDDVVQLLKDHWLDFDFFKVPDGEAVSTFAKVDDLYGRNLLLAVDDAHNWKELFWVRTHFFAHLAGEKASALTPAHKFESFNQVLETIRRTGDFPKNEQQQLLENLTAAVEAGASPADLYREGARLGITNTFSVERIGDALQRERDSKEDIEAAIERFSSAGEVPSIRLEDFFPADWLPSFQVLREGVGFTDDCIVAAVVAATGAMLPPSTRVHAFSMTQKAILWLFFVGVSGAAKSVIFDSLIVEPLLHGVIPALDGITRAEAKEYRQAKAAHDQAVKKRPKDKAQAEELPPLIPPEKPRPKSTLYTSPTTQGLACDMADFGHLVPGLLAKDELSDWYADLNNPTKANDRPFWLTAYDGTPINQSFATQDQRRIDEWAMSVIAFCQVQVFLDHLPEGNANGFNSRPLVFQIRKPKKKLLPHTPATKRLPEMLADIYEAAFRLGPLEPQLSALQTGIAVDQSLPAVDLSRRPQFWLEEAAQRQFERVFDQFEEKGQTSADDDEDAIWAKASGQVLRFAAAVQFLRDYTGREEPSDQWMPPEDILPLSELANLQQRFAPEQLEDHIRKLYPRISLESFDLATKLVIAGKTRSVEFVHRAKDPTLQMMERFLAVVEKRTPKVKGQGVKLSQIRKEGWPSDKRPTTAQITQLAQVAAQHGHLIRLPNGDVRSIKK